MYIANVAIAIEFYIRQLPYMLFFLVFCLKTSDIQD